MEIRSTFIINDRMTPMAWYDIIAVPLNRLMCWLPVGPLKNSQQVKMEALMIQIRRICNSESRVQQPSTAVLVT